MKTLFLSHKDHLSDGGGGNQICTREYRDALVAAGFELQNVTNGTDRSPATRLWRKVFPDLYPKLIPKEFLVRVREACQKESPEFVFCNFSNYLPIASQLRAVLPAQTKLILLSHGLVSVDDVHRDRIAGAPYAKGHVRRLGPALIGKAMITEMKNLPIFDHVFCLAEFEVSICRWLGARSVSWWPRTFPAASQLSWRPCGSRVGIIGTLDHPPNLEGAYLFCEAVAKLSSVPFRLRLITRSKGVATELASQFKFVDFVGSLDDEKALQAEVNSWSIFLHPIFCYAMGCSTKVAVGLSWGLPVLTTPAGLRGYRFSEGMPATVNTPLEMADYAAASVSIEAATKLREQSLRILDSAPTVKVIGAEIAAQLNT